MLPVTAEAVPPDWALEPSKNPVDWILWFDSNAVRHWNTGFVDLQENDPGEQGLSSAPGCLACVIAPRLDRWRAHKQDAADQFAQRKKEQLDKEPKTLNAKVRKRAAVKVEADRRQQGKEKPADTKVLAPDQLQPTEADTAAFAAGWASGGPQGLFEQGLGHAAEVKQEAGAALDASLSPAPSLEKPGHEKEGGDWEHPAAERA